MEEILQIINGRFISLNAQDVQRNNVILREVLNTLTDVMRKNKLFDELFRGIYYGGSYYDGLRVGAPEEYDLDLLFTLPGSTGPKIINSDLPGYVHVPLETMHIFDRKLEDVGRYPGLKKWLDDDNYVVTSKVYSWMEGVIKKALDQFPSGSQFTTSYGVFHAKTHKAGPAFTLKLAGNVNGEVVKLDIDLVPCFVFTQNNWPAPPYRPNPVKEREEEFFVVPKKPNNGNDVGRNWRLSFQKQESLLIIGREKLKPALKLLKKLRNKQNTVYIASYYIKTIFLWEVEENEALFNNSSLGFVFMQMLRRYREYIERGRIPYYWNQENNLIDKVGVQTLQNTANQLNTIIKRIENNPEYIAEYLLTREEYLRFRALHNRRVDALANAIGQLHLEPQAVAAAPMVVEKASENSSWCSLM